MEPLRTRPMPWWSAVLLPALAAVTAATLVLLVGTLRGQGEAAADPLNLAAISIVALGLALWVGLAVFHPTTRARDALHVSSVPLSWVALAGVAGAALQLPLAELSHGFAELAPALHPTAETQLQQKSLVEPRSIADGIAAVVALVAVAPWLEELLFRGMLLPGLAARYGDSVAMWVTTFAFGCMHFTASSIAPAWVAGLVLAWIAFRTGSVVPCVAAHAAFNGVPLLLPERLMPIPGFNVVSEGVIHVPWLCVIVSSVCAVTALAGLGRLTSMEPLAPTERT